MSFSYPLIVRDRNDKRIRRYVYADRAVSFMVREVAFHEAGVLTLNHQLGLTIATVRLQHTGGIHIDIHDRKLFDCFK